MFGDSSVSKEFPLWPVDTKGDLFRSFRRFAKHQRISLSQSPVASQHHVEITYDGVRVKKDVLSRLLVDCTGSRIADATHEGLRAGSHFLKCNAPGIDPGAVSKRAVYGDSRSLDCPSLLVVPFGVLYLFAEILSFLIL